MNYVQIFYQIFGNPEILQKFATRRIQDFDEKYLSACTIYLLDLIKMKKKVQEL